MKTGAAVDDEILGPDAGADLHQSVPIDAGLDRTLAGDAVLDDIDDGAGRTQHHRRFRHHQCGGAAFGHDLAGDTTARLPGSRVVEDREHVDGAIADADGGADLGDCAGYPDFGRHRRPELHRLPHRDLAGQQLRQRQARAQAIDRGDAEQRIADLDEIPGLISSASTTPA